MLPRLSTLILLSMAVFPVAAQRMMSLEDCVQYALNNHPEITLAKLEIRDADWRIKENTAIVIPNISAGVNYQYFIQQPAIPASAFGFMLDDPDARLMFALRNNLAGTIGVSQLLFDNSFFQGIKAAREYRKYVDIRLVAVQRELRNKVTDAYLPSLLLTENVTILDKNIGVQEHLFFETQEVMKAGFAEQLDVDRIEYTLTTLRSERDNLLRQRDILVDVLKFNMHMPVYESITLSDDVSRLLFEFASITPDAQLDLNNKPDYQAVVKARELSEIQVNIYEQHWLPSLTGFVQYQPSFQGNDRLYWIPGAIAGFQIKIPIYDGGMSRARKERAIVTTLQVDVQKATLEHAYQLELESARKQFANATVRVQNEERNLSLAQRIYDTSQTKFQAGVGSSFELTQAQAGLYQSQSMLVQARYELLLARVALKKALGL
jgi:outer membrane protein